MKNLNYNNIDNINENTISNIVSNNNVTSLGNSNTLNYYMKLFFEELTKNTREQYICVFNSFFTFILNKKWYELEWNDLINEDKINFTTVKKYKNHLIYKGLSNKTINYHIRSLGNLYTQLSYNKLNISLVNQIKMFSDVFKQIKRLPEITDHYGAFSPDNMNDLMEYAKTEKIKPNIKYLIIRILYCTGMRISAVCDLTWRNIVEDYDSTENIYFYKIKNKYDKTKDVSNFLPKVVSDELLEFKKKYPHATDDRKIFDINPNTILAMINRFCEKKGLDKKGRKLCTHSIKHSGALKTYNKTGKDIEMVAKYANHSNIQTSLNYINSDNILANDPTFHFFDKVDLSILDNSSKEDLVEAIKKCCPEGIQNQIVQFLKSK